MRLVPVPSTGASIITEASPSTRWKNMPAFAPALGMSSRNQRPLPALRKSERYGSRGCARKMRHVKKTGLHGSKTATLSGPERSSLTRTRGRFRHYESPRACSSASMSGGMGVSNSSFSPVLGCVNPRRAAWSACRGKSSPASFASGGRPRAAAGTRRR